MGDDFIGDLSPDKPAEVRIHYLAYQDQLNANVVFRILRSDGLTCLMLRTSIDDVTLPIRAGKGIITVTMEPLQLRGGSYYIQAMIRDKKQLTQYRYRNF